MRISRFPSIVDEVSIRLVAAGVLLLATLALVSGQWWLYPLLAIDFTLRAGWGPSASPLARLVQRSVRPRVSAAPRYTAGPPKRFAAAIGAVMTGLATVLWATSVEAGVWVVGGVMVLFPALEALLGLCVGCILFGWLMRAGLVPEEVCLDCADIGRRTRSAPANV
jgi:Domain of unknown function (DUF4395)